MNQNVRSTNSLTFTKPFNGHVHLRDNQLLEAVVGHTAKQFAMAIVMPNLQPPIINAAMACHYKEKISALIAKTGNVCSPLMSLYLTDSTSHQDVDEVAKNPDIIGFKLYPANATTNSAQGVTDIKARYRIFRMMEDLNIPLFIHGETVTNHVDIFDRERIFVETTLRDLCDKFPKLKITLEHITTKYAADFVENGPPNLGATITPHHLIWNRNAIFRNGLRPDAYCLPILKREEDRQALLRAATSANPRFFAGTDSAPHTHEKKYAACGCAGIFCEPVALSAYAGAFDSIGRIDTLENFLCAGYSWYNLPVSTQKITLQRKPFTVPISYNECLTPFLANETLQWSVV